MADDNKLVKMGFVKAAFGVQGWVKVSAHTEYVDSLLDFDEWFLGKDEKWQTFKFEEGKVTPDGLLVKFSGVIDRDQAHALKGHTIAIPRDEFDSLEEDEFYWADLVGLSVVNLTGENLGDVVDLMQTGAHDVLVIKGQHGQKLIPFIKQFVGQVDMEQKKIHVDWGIDY